MPSKSEMYKAYCKMRDTQNAENSKKDKNKVAYVKEQKVVQPSKDLGK